MAPLSYKEHTRVCSLVLSNNLPSPFFLTCPPSPHRHPQHGGSGDLEIWSTLHWFPCASSVLASRTCGTGSMIYPFLFIPWPSLSLAPDPKTFAIRAAPWPASTLSLPSFNTLPLVVPELRGLVFQVSLTVFLFGHCWRSTLGPYSWDSSTLPLSYNPRSHFKTVT